jgi:hypothetical protein
LTDTLKCATHQGRPEEIVGDGQLRLLMIGGDLSALLVDLSDAPYA